MRILLIGGAGYIGSHLNLALGDAGYTLHTWDTASGTQLVHGSYERLDAQAPDSCLASLRAHPCDAVIHLAARTSVPDSVRDPVGYHAHNLQALLGPLQAIGQLEPAQRPRCFLYASSAAVYGSDSMQPVPHTAALAPYNPYGAGKWMCERILHDTAQALGMRVAVLRCFNVAGADPLKRAGCKQPEPTQVIPQLVRTMLKLQLRFHLYGDQWPTPDGTAIRDFLHVCDLADAHITVLEHLRNTPAPGVLTFNVGYGKGHSLRALIQQAEELVGRPLPVQIHPARPGDVPMMVADPAPLYALGWRPKHNQLDTLLRTEMAFASHHLSHK